MIHVCDEARKVNRDFTCSKKLLLKEMKYFESYLSSSNQYDDIDISVHCDVYIFEWLMRFINRPSDPPELKCKSAVSILISSDFLRMQRLVDKCLQFVHDHVNEVIKLPIDLNCINAGLVTRLAALFTVPELERIEDRRDKLRGKLWMKRVESLLEKPGNVLVCCAECGKVYCRRFQSMLTCSRAKPSIDFHGNVISRHVPLGAGQWKMRQYIHTLRSQRKVAWDVLYWRLWGMFHMFQCTVCGDAFPACEYNHCVFHPEAAKFGTGQNRGSYPCCGKEALRFDTTMRKSGCRARSHTVATSSLSSSLSSSSGSSPGSGSGRNPVGEKGMLASGGDSFGVGKGIVGVGISMPGSPKGGVSEEETTNHRVNDLIAHLDMVTIPFVSESSCGGYADDRIAGMANGDAIGASDKKELMAGSKGGRRKSESSSKSSSRSNRGNGLFGSSSTPRRPGNSSSGGGGGGSSNSRGGRSVRPSTASGGRGSSSSNNGRPSSLPITSGGSDFRNGIIGFNANSIGPDHMGQAGGISMSMAGKAVITPEAFRVNPQRRSMWKLDLQREEDVVRMQALLQKLEKMRGSPEVEEYTW